MLIFTICLATLAIALIYLFMIFPSVRRRDVSAFYEKPTAHRGIHDADGVAENSLSAFRLAIDAGLPIELDVRITSDGVPVVIHDGYLDRLCGADTKVHLLTKSELDMFRLTEGGESIPSLREVLELVSGKVPLLIELKGLDISPLADRAVDVLRDYTGEYIIESFNPYDLYRFRKLSPDIPIGFLSQRGRGDTFREKLFKFLSQNVLFNFLFRPDFIAYKYTDDLPLSVKLCRALGCRMFGWTIRSGKAYTANRDKFDGLICEKIDEIMK